MMKLPFESLRAWQAGTWLLLLVIGWLLGSLMTGYGLLRPVPFEIVDDESAGVPVVHILGIEDSALLGVTTGNVRIFAGDEQIAIDGSGSFAITDRDVLSNRLIMHAPEGMQFVASKRGSKYYPVGSSQSFTIVPENRIYFPNAASAEAAGYKR